MTVSPLWRLSGYDLTFELLLALAEIPDRYREAWVDRYVLGLPYASNTARTRASIAAVQLRELLADRRVAA